LCLNSSTYEPRDSNTTELISNQLLPPFLSLRRLSVFRFSTSLRRISFFPGFLGSAGFFPGLRRLVSSAQSLLRRQLC